MRFSKPKRPITLMEICGTHTMAIAKSGIKSLLPKEVKLISGPGCPVCVTPSSAIDMALELTKDPDLIVCSYGDLLRIPGSQHETLRNRPNVRLCLSPMDAIELAFKNPEKTIMFIGVGFETTAPGSAILIQEARRNKLTNFYFYSLLKRTKPAIRALLENEMTQIDGFLCPGHVAVILGEKGFVTGVLDRIINSEKVDYVIAVGPMPMMRAVADMTRDKGIYTEASMNPIMVDGTGMCGACRVTVGGETKFACVDGPDFNAHLIDFDEVINRTKIYKEQELSRNENCNLFKMADKR